MKVQLLKRISRVGEAGLELEIEKGQALSWIERGIAKEVKKAEPKKVKKVSKK